MSPPFKQQRELKDESDETAYLLSSPANAKRLEQARREFEREQWVEVEDLDELMSIRLMRETRQ